MRALLSGEPLACCIASNRSAVSILQTANLQGALLLKGNHTLAPDRKEDLCLPIFTSNRCLPEI